MPGLELKGIVKRYGGRAVLDGLALGVGNGEFVAVLGPSGCGKTTLLRIIMGLSAPDEGTLRWQDEDIAGRPPEDRGFGFVFQHYALLPHLTALGNVVFPLAARQFAQSRSWANKLRYFWRAPGEGLSREHREQALAALKLVRLEGFAERRVSSLSGGEAQRVSLARSLVTRPRMLLMDEPLANVDRQLKIELREEIRRLHRELGITFVYVTHDQEEAVTLAGRIALLHRGRIVQTGAPKELLANPADDWVRSFFNLNNIVSPELLKLTKQ